jgi:hypothetical protein
MPAKAKWCCGVLIAAAVLVGGASSSSVASAVVTGAGSATLRFHGGRQSLLFRLHEPAGAIDLYSISVPRGVKVRASVQLPGITVPIRIATRPTGSSSSCANVRSRVRCTVGEEGCPMPEGTWHVHVEKLAGPAGDVRLWFRTAGLPA